MRTHCKVRRPDLTFEDERKKLIPWTCMVCPAEGNKMLKRKEKIQEYQ